MDLGIEDKGVWGANNGIVLAVASTLAGERACVVMAARTTGPLDEAVGAVRAARRNALTAPADMTTPEGVAAAVDAATGMFGPVDIAVSTLAAPRRRTLR
jgi:3-oxoacyl-[acyl-carrier protein] reductase